MAEKLDLIKELKDLYRPPVREPVLVKVPELPFLMVDGEGDPNTSPDYAQCLQALFSTSYGIKFMVKRGPQGIDYRVMPLEGLWWSEDMADFTQGRREGWKWTMMIAQPLLVTTELLDRAVAEAAGKRDLPALERIRLECFEEGLSAQIMHLGPYSAERPTIGALHAFIADQGYALGGKHHEIYVGDPRRTAPERLRTIVRQPVRPRT
jgi:hypothetical protein